jgi:hypothetical protein
VNVVVIFAPSLIEISHVQNISIAALFDQTVIAQTDPVALEEARAGIGVYFLHGLVYRLVEEWRHVSLVARPRVFHARHPERFSLIRSPYRLFLFHRSYRRNT